MAQFLYKIGRGAYAHKWRFIAVWLIILVGIGAAASAFSKPTSDSFTIPGLDSVETADQLRENFPEQGSVLEAPSGTIVMHSDKSLADPEVNAEVMKFIEELQQQDYLAQRDQIVPPTLAAAGLTQQLTATKQAQGLPAEQIQADIKALSPLSEDQKTGQVDVLFDAESSTKIDPDDLTSFKELVNKANDSDADLEISYLGNAFLDNDIESTSEIVGIIVAALVLLIVFGSLVAAGMPLITALVGVGIGVLGVTAATALSDNINSMTPVLATMIGLAVGIDYALFIVSRFRKEAVIYMHGQDFSPRQFKDSFQKLSMPERAHLAGVAVGKAGSAVIFAGTTVLIALTALTIIRIPFLTTMALAAALTVAIAVLVAITLLPAILGLFGRRTFSAVVPFVSVPDPNGSKTTMGTRWVSTIRKHALVTLLAGALVLVVLAIPAAQLRLAMPTDGSMPVGSPARVAYDTRSDAFGAGRNAPIIALVEAPDTPAQAQPGVYGSVTQSLQEVSGVVNAQVTGMSDTAAMLLITPSVGSTDPQSREVLEALRDKADSILSDQNDAQSGLFKDVSIGFTGSSPIFEDISDRLEDALIPYIAIVLVLAFILLMIVFRSFWVPLIAALGFALSVAATFGLTVAIFQNGALGIISDPQPIISFMPIMLIGIVFGLAMDYEVFTVSGMREGWTQKMSAKDATSYGFTLVARVVAGAALIMISVFAAFILMDMQFIKTMGFALAAAVFFDAFIVRMTLIPATMFLLGSRAWKIPGWLDKILPTIDVEGENLNAFDYTDGSASAVDTAEELDAPVSDVRK